MTSQTIVYSARNLVNGHWYVGYTGRGLKTREGQHRATARRGNGTYLLHRAIQKYGQENFVFEVLHDFDGDEDLAKVYEWEMIAKHKPEYNLSYGGDGGTLPESTRKKIGDANRGKKNSPETIAKMREAHRGKKHTVEARQKISQANRGRVSATKGKPVSEETRAKLREANRGQIPWSAGKKHREETKQKMSAWQIGRKLSDEHRQNIGAARRKISKTPTEAMKAAWARSSAAMLAAKKLPVQCVEDGRVFDCGSDADRFYGLTLGSASRVVSGEKPHVKQLHFVRHIPETE